MYKIAVMGDRESVLGFKALGLETVVPESVSSARSSLISMARDNYAIIFITEALAEVLADEIQKYNESATPAVILIPGREGSMGIAMAALKNHVERAVGADIL